jgi:excisionase family DNA binding protein
MASGFSIRESEKPSLASERWFSMDALDEILTVEEVARTLRCSKAHVYKAISGLLDGVSPLPSIPMGRRRLIRRSTLEEWKAKNEQSARDAMLIASPKITAVGA